MKPEEADLFYESFKDKLPCVITSASDFAIVMGVLTIEQRKYIFDLVKLNIEKFINSATDFSNLLVYLSVEECTEVCSLVENKIQFIIKQSTDVFILFNVLRPLQKKTVFALLNKYLIMVINSTYDFFCICESLSDNLSVILYEQVKFKLLNVCNLIQDFKNIFCYLNIEQFKEFCKIKKETIRKEINSIECFVDIVSNLELQHRVAIFELMKSNLNNLIKGSNDFSRLICSFILGEKYPGSNIIMVEDKLWSELFEIVKENLLRLIKNIEDFQIVIHPVRSLNIIIYKDIYYFLREKVLTFIKDVDDIADVLNHLKNEELKDFCLFIKMNKSDLIVLPDNVNKILSKIQYLPNRNVIKSIFSTSQEID